MRIIDKRWNSFAPGYRRAVLELWEQLDFILLPVPVVAAVILGILNCYGYYTPALPTLEDLAVVFLSCSTAGCFVRFLIQRRPFFLWSTLVSSVLLSREIHFAGTSMWVYIGLILLCAAALHFYDRLRDYLCRRFVVNLLAMGFFAYLISVTLDARWWKPRPFSPGIPGEATFHAAVEESMEIVGHLLIGAALVFSRRRRPSALGASQGS